jgi:hypothetical protein
MRGTKPLEYVALGALALMLLGFLGMMVALERDTRNLKKGLPQAQMRFALCYRLVQELKYFQNDELPRHLEEAMKLWTILLMYLYWMLNPSREQLMLSRIQAFSQVHTKISARLRDGVEVPQLAAALNHLLTFFFSLIPAKAADPEITKRGREELLAFAQNLARLSPYPEAIHPNLFSRIASKVYSVPEVFAHENALVRAVAWYLPVMAIYSVGMLIARWRIPDLNLQGVLISSWIGVPLTIAVAAAVATGRRNG